MHLLQFFVHNRKEISAFFNGILRNVNTRIIICSKLVYERVELKSV